MLKKAQLRLGFFLFEICENSMQIKRIAIIGGGTAGWLAANHLGLELSAQFGYEITLIESPNVPIIGVGEGTVPHIRATLARFEISEAEFIDCCDVTFKQGIKFVNWLDSKKHGDENYYYHPFDPTYNDNENWAPFWLNSGMQKSYADFVGIQEKACNDFLSPKLISSLPYQGPLNYAYHLNAVKFAKLLAKNAQERFGVIHKFANIECATKGTEGEILSLLTSEGETLAFDFYIDCSGFHSILIEKELAVPLIDKSSQIITNAALAIQIPNENEPIPPFTIATAHKAGWIWDIALLNRRGVGFVYSDKHMSESEAMSSFSSYLGVELESMNPRRVPMRIGYRKKLWEKNCVALGLAQGFVEPLEATSILVTDYAAEYLAKGFPKTADQIESFSRRFNTTFTYVWERVIDFVQLHYFLSDRRDSQFWLDNTEGAQLSDELKLRLEVWKNQVPERQDFFSKFEVFDVDNYLYILYGMKYPTRHPVRANNTDVFINQCVSHKNQQFNALKDKLPNHRTYLEKLKQHMSRLV